MRPTKDFFDAERKKVFTPGPFFTERVLARLGQPPRESGIWEVIPVSTRSVLALALVLILCFAVVQVIIPQIPQRGMIEAYLEADQNPAEVESVSRRSFLGVLLGFGAVVVGAALSVPLLRFALHPLLTKTTEIGWSRPT